MCDTTFTFGQRGGYHFETLSKWKFGRLPDELAQLFATNDSTEISSCYQLVLGAGDSFFISYKGKGGLDHFHSRGLPEQLHTFLDEKNAAGEHVRNFPGLRVALGPYNKAWWATDGAQHSWSNLPKGLNDFIRSKRANGGNGAFTDAPRFITLGTDGNYFAVTMNNAAAWCLEDYRELKEIISGCKDSAAGVSNIHNLVIHPYRLQTWVVQTTSGLVLGWNLPPHMQESFEEITVAVKDDTTKHMEPLAGQEKLRALQAANQQRLAAQQVAARRQINQTNAPSNLITAMTLGIMLGRALFMGIDQAGPGT